MVPVLLWHRHTPHNCHSLLDAKGSNNSFFPLVISLWLSFTRSELLSASYGHSIGSEFYFTSFHFVSLNLYHSLWGRDQPHPPLHRREQSIGRQSILLKVKLLLFEHRGHGHSFSWDRTLNSDESYLWFPLLFSSEDVVLTLEWHIRDSTLIHWSDRYLGYLTLVPTLKTNKMLSWFLRSLEEERRCNYTVG